MTRTRFAAAEIAELTENQRRAAALLYVCTKALEEGTVPDHVQQNILDAYAALDVDAIATGKKFIAGRKLGTIGPVRAWLQKYMGKHPKGWRETSRKWFGTMAGEERPKTKK